MWWLTILLALAQATVKPVDWESLIPVIRPQLKAEFGTIEEPYPLRVERVADVTGDGVSEALINLGNSGASTDLLALMRMEDGRPVIATFRAKDGTVGARTLFSGASAMHSDSTELVAGEQAVVATHYEMGEKRGEVRDCGAEAYRWNEATAIFDFDRRLSDSHAQEYCGKLKRRPRGE